MKSREERIQEFRRYRQEQERIAQERPSGRPRYAVASQTHDTPPAHGQNPDKPMSQPAAAAKREREEDASREQVYRQKKSRLAARIAEDQARESGTRIFGEQQRRKSRGR